MGLLWHRWQHVRPGKHLASTGSSGSTLPSLSPCTHRELLAQPVSSNPSSLYDGTAPPRQDRGVPQGALGPGRAVQVLAPQRPVQFFTFSQLRPSGLGLSLCRTSPARLRPQPAPPPIIPPRSKVRGRDVGLHARLWGPGWRGWLCPACGGGQRVSGPCAGTPSAALPCGGSASTSTLLHTHLHVSGPKQLRRTEHRRADSSLRNHVINAASIYQ